MSDWRHGDLALCVSRSGWMMAVTGLDSDGPRCGAVYVVRAIKVAPHGTFLGFAEFPRAGYHHTGFIKVTPDADLIAEERKAGVLA